MNIEEEQKLIRDEYKKNLAFLLLISLTSLAAFVDVLYFEPFSHAFLFGFILAAIVFFTILQIQRNMKEFVKRLPD